MADVLSDEFYDEAETRLKSRLSDKRFRHSVSVSSLAVSLAKTYGADERKARIAGLLHDWDKCLSDEEARTRADELGIENDSYVYETMPHLLHGMTAATALAKDIPDIPADVTQAIARHTSAAVDMTDLDMIIYIADVIEPHRPYGSMDSLRDAIGIITLEELFLRTFKQVFSHLIASDYRIHPDTIKVWNYYINRARNARGKGTL